MLLSTCVIKLSHCLTKSENPLIFLKTLLVSIISRTVSKSYTGIKQLTYMGINILPESVSLGAQNMFSHNKNGIKVVIGS